MTPPGNGPDGFWSLTSLPEDALNTLNTLKEGSHMNPESLMAYIIVLPKEGQDLTTCTSYRSISLLNVGIKLYTKIMVHYSHHSRYLLLEDDKITRQLLPDEDYKTLKILNKQINTWYWYTCEGAVRTLYQTNYTPLLNSVKDELCRIPTKSPSWIGPINVIKIFFFYLNSFINSNAPHAYTSGLFQFFKILNHQICLSP